MSEPGKDVIIEIEKPRSNPGIGQVTVETPPPPAADDFRTDEEALALMMLLA